MPYAVACSHCEEPVLTTRHLTDADWQTLRTHVAACRRRRRPLLPIGLGDVLMNFRVADVPRTPCKLRDTEDTYSILFRVRYALKVAGREGDARDFLELAEGCQSRDELLRIAREYVADE